MRREDYFDKQYFYDNSAGSTPITRTVTNTVGISETESETYRVTAGLKISSSSGCDLIGGSVEVECSRRGPSDRRGQLRQGGVSVGRISGLAASARAMSMRFISHSPRPRSPMLPGLHIDRMRAFHAGRA
jgi:hypothetical protein